MASDDAARSAGWESRERLSFRRGCAADLSRPLRRIEVESESFERAEREHAEYAKSPTPKDARVSKVAFATNIFVFLS